MILSRLKMFALSAILLMGACLCAPDTSMAASSQAHQELEKTINEVLVELQKPELKSQATRNAVLARVEKIIDRLFSFEELSARTVGANWHNFTPDQQKRFIDVFTTLLRESYLEKLDGYNGETVTYLSETASKNGDKVEINTSVNIKGKPVPVAYRMLKKNQWEVYDVIIEGVSMVQNYRSQFQQLLVSGDAEKLIEQVRIKAEEAQAQNKKLQMGS